jgi:hypothetical protein
MTIHKALLLHCCCIPAIVRTSSPLQLRLPRQAVQRRQAVSAQPQLPQSGQSHDGSQIPHPIGPQLQQRQGREVAYALRLLHMQCILIDVN